MSTRPDPVRFSVCIPNFNYGRYLGDTLRSALGQEGVEVDVVVADNASTDASVAVVQGFDDPRLHLEVNPCNVGFAANLDRAVAPAAGDWAVLLSSDDVLAPGALRRYAELLALLPNPLRVVVGGACSVIDGDGERTGRRGPPGWAWTPGDLDPVLSEALRARVYRVAAPVMLRRCLLTMRTPFVFASTAYPRSLHRAIGGYGGGRLSNPDKWFLWRLLGVVDELLFIDEELAGYRVHGANQSDLQAAEGGLRHLVDEYSSTLEISHDLLLRAGLTREDVQRAFVRHDVALRGLGELAAGRRSAARRRVQFGVAAYPQIAKREPVVWVLRGLCALGPGGTAVARWARRSPAVLASAMVTKVLGGVPVDGVDLDGGIRR